MKLGKTDSKTCLREQRAKNIYDNLEEKEKKKELEGVIHCTTVQNREPRNGSTNKWQLYIQVNSYTLVRKNSLLIKHGKQYLVSLWIRNQVG
jgi:hypothetical protein